MSTVSLSGLNRAIAVLQYKMEATPPDSPNVAALQQDIQHLHQHLKQILSTADVESSGLTTASQRGLLWLEWLVQPESLRQYLKTLQALVHLAAHTRKPASWQAMPIHVRLYLSANLTQGRLLRNEQVEMTIHPGFVGAPQAVLQALVEIALGASSDAKQARVRAYARSATFQAVQQALTPGPPAARTDGRYYPLEEIFERINQEYFAGQVEKPHLTWSRTCTRRKFGHYDYHTDTLMISRTLDDPSVPVYVVEAVMHHELLHKYLGFEKVNGQRRAHTPAFRAAERRFAQYAEAQAYLKAIAARGQARQTRS